MPTVSARLGEAHCGRRGDVGGVADAEADLDVRTAGGKHYKLRRQPVGSDRAARLDPERPGDASAAFGRPQTGDLGPGEHRTRVVEEEPPGLGRHPAAGDAIEAADGVPVFERPDRGADRRLRQAERRRGTGHGFAFGDDRGGPCRRTDPLTCRNFRSSLRSIVPAAAIDPIERPTPSAGARAQPFFALARASEIA